MTEATIDINQIYIILKIISNIKEYDKLINTSDNMIEIDNGNYKRIINDEHRKNLGNGNRGKKQSVEWKDKLSRARKGLKRTDETKNRISESMSGRKLSEEHRQKLKSRVITDEWRLKLSIAAKNRKNKNN